MKTKITKVLSLFGLVLLLMFGVMFTNNSYSQTTVNIGTGTLVNTGTTYPSVYGQYWSGHRVQYLISASEIIAAGGYAGNISALSFDITTPAPPTNAGTLASGANLKNFTVKIGSTSLTALTSSYVSGLTQVFTASQYVSVAGLNTHSFSSNFNWDGVSNIIIETCFDNYNSGSDYSSNSISNATTTTFASYLSYTSDGGGVCTNASGTASSDRPNLKLTFLPAAALNAGIQAITNPTSPASAGTHNIVATFKNSGTTTLTSATIGWSIDGVVKTPFNWTGSLATMTSTPITLGSNTFAVGNHVIKVWSSAPNGGTDGYLGDDTATSSVLFSNSMTGVFHVGVGKTYTTLTSAIADYNTRPLAGPVTFILDDTLYSAAETFPIVINENSLGSAINTLTIKPNTGVNVVIQGSVASNSLIKINGADYVTIDGSNGSANTRNLTIHNTNITSPSGISIVSLGTTAGANYNTIKNCNISTVLSSAAGYGIAVGAAAPGTGADNNDYCTIQNNAISTVTNSIFAMGTATGALDSLKIIGNELNSVVTTVVNYGVRVGYATNSIISKNNISIQTTNSSQPAGISCETGFVNSIVDANYIMRARTTSTGGYGGRGITIGTGSTTSSVYVTNNIIRGVNGSNYSSFSNSSAIGIAIGVTGSTLTTVAGGVYVYHNTVNLDSFYTYGSNCLTAALYIGSAATALDIRNNIFSNTLFNNNSSGSASKNYAVYSAAANTAFTTIDYNDYFVAANAQGKLAYLAADKTTLADWQTATAQDLASVNVDPTFISTFDVTPNTVAVNNIGTSISYVTTDFFGNSRSATPDLGAIEFTIPNNDASVFSFDGPIGVCAGISSPVLVTIKNSGLLSISSCNVNWSVNGVVQTPFAYIGSLASGTTTQVTLGSLTLAANTSYNIKVWTSLPNAVADEKTNNDTLWKNNLTSALSGTYTIGNTGTWPSFGAAITALNSSGVCGPVVINVASGTYTEQIAMTSILGASATNTITFKSATGVKTDVVLTYASASSTLFHTLLLDGADFTSWKNMTISGTGTYARPVVMQNAADYNVFDGNNITTLVTTSSNYYGFYATGFNQNNLLNNNVITGGYYGLYFYGVTTTPRPVGNRFTNNSVIKPYYYGNYIYYLDSTEYKNNKFDNSGANSSTFYNYFGYCRGIQLVGNSFNIVASGSIYGVYVYYSDSLTTQRSLVANNFITTSGGTGTHYSLYSYYTNGVDFYHNSVNGFAGSTTAGAAFYQSNGSNINIKNNIFARNNGGYAYYIATPAAIIESDFNNLYTSTGNVAYWTLARADLMALQTASTKDMYSISFNPNYASATDLHLNNSNINGMGTPVSSVLVDIDGDVRNSSTPDIGADEFDLINEDAGILSVDEPSAACPGTPANVVVTIKNFGLNTLGSCTINWTVNGVAQTPYSYTGSLANGATAQVTIGTYSLIANTAANFKVWPTNTNSLPDQKASNDTAVAVKFASIPAGTYTIGAASGSTYANFTAAVNDLNLKGICGPVVFNVQAGVYTEQILLNQIVGTSNVNTITFKSANLDSTSVTLQYAALTSNDNYVVRLNGADYITFDKMTIKSTTTTTYGQVFDIFNSASNITISNCIVEGIVTTSSLANVINSGSVAGYENYTTIINNKVLNGYYGIYWYGTSTTREFGSRIIGNSVSNFYLAGIYGYYQDSLIIQNNVVTKTLNTTSTYGIYLNTGNRGATISGNTINMTQVASTNYGIYSATVHNGLNISNNTINSTNTGSNYGIYLSNTDTNTVITKNRIKVNSNTTSYGMYFTGVDGNATGSVLVANNMIVHENGASGAYGIYSTAGNYINYYYNSVNLFGGTNATSYGLYLTGGTYNNVVNNILSNKNTGIAYYVSAATVVTNTDYNLLYTTGANVAYWTANRTTLSALQTASSKDLYSLSSDPTFVSNTNLKKTIITPNDMGTPVSVLDDIDGETRKSTPDMGADEWDPITSDLLVYNFVQPVSKACGNATDSIIIKVLNNGLNSQANVPVTTVINTPNGIVTVTGIIPSITTGQILNVYVGTFNSLVPGTYSFKSYINLTSDLDHTNDTIMSIMNITIPYTSPMLDNFVANANNWIHNMTYYASGSHGSTSAMIGKNMTSTATSGYAMLNNKVSGITNKSVLTFDYRIVNSVAPYDQATIVGDSIKVLVSSDCGTTFSTLYVIDAVNHIAASTFRSMQIPLSTYSGTDLQVRFELVWNSGSYFVDFDNIGVSEPVIVNLGNDTAVCVGNSVIFDAGTSSTYTLAYEWTNAGSSVVIGNSRLLTAYTTGSYIAKVSTQYGLSTIDTVVFTVNAPPTVSYTGLAATYCANSTAAVLTGVPAGGTFTGTGISNGAFNATAANLGFNYITYTYTDGNGCTNSKLDSTDVKALPVFTVSNDTAVCYGDSATIGVLTSGLDYLWSTTSTTQSIVAKPTTAATYYVTVKNADNCAVVDSIMVGVHALPIVNLGNDKSACAGQSVSLNAGSGFASYLWSNTATTQTINVDSTGIGVGFKNFVAIVTDANTCKNSDTVKVTFMANPIVTISGPTEVKRSFALTLDAGAGFTSYLWSNGATTQTITEPANTLAPSVTLHYTVTVTNASNCTATATHSVYVINDVSINEAGNNYDLNIYPNPTSGKFNVTIDGFSGNIEMQVVDLTGKMITSEVLNVTSNFVKEVNVSSLAKGVYYIKMISENGVRTEKLIVQ